MPGFRDFKSALGGRESSNNYQAKNKYGYLGRYQFGLARLTDFGLCRRKEETTGWSNACFEWVAPFSEEMFLGAPPLQDLVFIAHVSDLRRRLSIFESGLVAGAHLNGFGGIQELLFKGESSKDALGTSILEYIKRFSGFDLD